MTSGSASLIRVRSRRSVSPRQSPSSSILASISSEADLLRGDSLFFMPVSPRWLSSGGVSLRPRQYLLHLCEEARPRGLGAVISLLLLWQLETRLLYAQTGPGARGR